MPFLQTIERDEVNISFWRATERQNEMLSFLPDGHDYAPTLNTFKSDRRRVEWLATRCLLHHLLGPDVRSYHLPSGRPFLLGSDLEISISHTDQLVAIALAPAGLEVGLDLEHNIDRAYRLMHRYLPEDEQAALVHNPTDAAMLWSAKEAIYKLCDTEGLAFLDDIHIYKECGQLLAELPTLSAQAVLDIDYLHDCAFALARYLR